jgi:hypothetical protein
MLETLVAAARTAAQVLSHACHASNCGSSHSGMSRQSARS